MKIVSYLLITIVILSLAFTGGAVAWTSNTAATVNPNSALMPGQVVFASMEVIMPTDGIGSDGYLIMSTSLDSPQWVVDIKYRNGDSPLTSREGAGRVLRLSGFELSYNEEIVIAVHLSGKVPNSAAGQEISVITVTQDPSKGSVSAYSSTKQSVYNPSDVPKQIENLQSGVDDLEAQIIEASPKGVNVTDAQEMLDQAKSALKAAQNAGTRDPATANKEIVSARGYLTESERLLVKSTLELVKANLDETDTILSEFFRKGMSSDTRVMLLSVTRQGVKNLYDTAKAGYDGSSGSVSDLVKTQSLEALTDSQQMITDARVLGGGDVPSYEVDLYNLTLQSGWNFVSVPKTLKAGNNTAESLFGTVDTSSHQILVYDAKIGNWTDLSEKDVIRPLTGVWIYSADVVSVPLIYPNTPTAPAVKMVYPGWNAIGLSASVPVTAINALSGVSWRTLIPWDSENGQWGQPIVYGGVSDADPLVRSMTPGTGYWLYVTEEGVLTGLTA